MNFSILTLLLLSSLLFENVAYSGLKTAENSFNRKPSLLSPIIVNLVDDELYYTAVPFLKEYIVDGSSQLDSTLDQAMSKILANTDISILESLPSRYLARSRSDSVAYVLAKKYLREGDFKSSLSYLNTIYEKHIFFPISLLMRGTIYSIESYRDPSLKFKALNYFQQCIKETPLFAKYPNVNYELNREYCYLGIARTLYSHREYEASELAYLDIEKDSPVWPEILFEEAWNSFYKKDYNRTLGKLVSYKAPIFDYIFNPEIDVLRALTFLKLCLYADAKKSSDDFYENYQTDFNSFSQLINQRKNDRNFFYSLILQFENSGSVGNTLVERMLKSIMRDPFYQRIKTALISIEKESSIINRRASGAFKREALSNLKYLNSSYKKILGSFIRRGIFANYDKMNESFEGMSYIKLETLARKKADLYRFDTSKAKRGDIKYLQRNEKQYFWDFIGEFWADELGDYVFALGSER